LNKFIKLSLSDPAKKKPKKTIEKHFLIFMNTP